ncbi:ParA family protein [Bilophila wadsworthia]|uniref:ParA family protein n=1 Tax=Bilophila wadsworthia TaxID=35833 RepID=UPI00242B601C|nr:AAA family ATPase [Bilophila wadsworthia]
MAIISVFNNKGGVGKTTLAYHLSNALAEIDKKVLMVDLDPQCNLTIHSIKESYLHDIWSFEQPFVDDFLSAYKKLTEKEISDLNKRSLTIHFMLKPVEDGAIDTLSIYAPPIKVCKNIDLIPGRLSINSFENKLSERWNGLYSGEPLSIRTISAIRSICNNYIQKNNYDYVVIDTSPSLGILNKSIISNVDGFMIPCQPDMFSLYGIMNIGNSLKKWKQDFESVYRNLSPEKRTFFPENFVQFLGYTIYNAKKYTKKGTNKNIALAHENFSKQIPITIEKYIEESLYATDKDTILKPIGGESIKHTHNTLPNMAQKYKTTIWKVPFCDIDKSDKMTVNGNKRYYTATKEKYIEFVKDLMSRLPQ